MDKVLLFTRNTRSRVTERSDHNTIRPQNLINYNMIAPKYRNTHNNYASVCLYLRICRLIFSVATARDFSKESEFSWA